MTSDLPSVEGRSCSLAQIESLGKSDPLVAGFIKRLLVKTYDQFLDVLLDDVITVISRLERDPQNYPNDEPEDATTQRLTDMLYAMTYRVSHNKQAGGNVDITVELFRFEWLCEAKKFNSVSDMREGYLQLATRYRPGMDSDGAMHGGLLGYVRTADAKGSMESWRKAFPTVEPAATTKDCARRPLLAFLSEHKNESFGVPMRLWHCCVAMHFAPRDKSGRTAARYKGR